MNPNRSSAVQIVRPPVQTSSETGNQGQGQAPVFVPAQPLVQGQGQVSSGSGKKGQLLLWGTSDPWAYG